MSNSGDCVAALVRRGADASLRSKAGITPSEAAAMAGNDDIAAYLAGDLSADRELSPSVYPPTHPPMAPSPPPRPVFDPASPPFMSGRSSRSESPTFSQRSRRMSQSSAAPEEAPSRFGSRLAGASGAGDRDRDREASSYAGESSRPSSSRPSTAKARPPLPAPIASSAAKPSTSLPPRGGSSRSAAPSVAATPTGAGSRSVTFDAPASSYSREGSPHRLSTGVYKLAPDHDVVALPQPLGVESERVREKMNTMWAKQRINDKSKAEAIKEVGVMWTVLEETEQLRQLEVQAYEAKSRKYKHQRAKALAALDSVFAKVWETTILDLHFQAWCRQALSTARSSRKVDQHLNRKSERLMEKCFYGWMGELKEKRMARSIRIGTYLKVLSKQKLASVR